MISTQATFFLPSSLISYEKSYLVRWHERNFFFHICNLNWKGSFAETLKDILEIIKNC